MTQLTLDVFAGTRIRPGVHPPASHQRGWFRLPYDFAAHPLPGHPAPVTGDLLPAWVCCRCGGVEANQFGIDNNHGCCTHWLGQHGTCSRLDALRRHRRLGIADRRWPLDACWSPERPP